MYIYICIYIYNAIIKDIKYYIKDIKDIIPDIANLATNTKHNAKINEVKTKYIVLLTELQLLLLMLKQMGVKTKYLILPS